MSDIENEFKECVNEDPHSNNYDKLILDINAAFEKQQKAIKTAFKAIDDAEQAINTVFDDEKKINTIDETINGLHKISKQQQNDVKCIFVFLIIVIIIIAIVICLVRLL